MVKKIVTIQHYGDILQKISEVPTSVAQSVQQCAAKAALPVDAE